MRRKPRGNLIGCISLVLGLLIVFSLILPTGFWWFLLGASFIGLGLYLNRRC